MIEVKKLYKSFNGNEVLKDINLTMHEGKCNLIIGKSGAGKTVLIKCMVGLFEPTKGEILYDNRDFVKMTDKERKHIRMEMGMLFQGNALFDSMTVEDNVRFPLDMFTSMTKKEKETRVDEILSRVNLIGAHKKFPSEISGGMMKRVGIARAIVQKPRYLFCDEPNSGLDPITSIVIDELIQEITLDLNITTVINTHDMNSVMGIGDKVIYIHQGEVHWEGSGKDVMASKESELNNFVFASKFWKTIKEDQK
jgi:phospholipid/cholesterol/gamma-HCH transport system ATP-binding protein